MLLFLASLTVLCIEQKNGIISDGGAEFVNAILGGGGGGAEFVNAIFLCYALKG